MQQGVVRVVVKSTARSGEDGYDERSEEHSRAERERFGWPQAPATRRAERDGSSWYFVRHEGVDSEAFRSSVGILIEITVYPGLLDIFISDWRMA